LPEPERPTIAANSPLHIDKEIFERALIAALPDAYCFEIPTVLTSGSGTSKAHSCIGEVMPWAQNADDQRFALDQRTVEQLRAFRVSLSNTDGNRQGATLSVRDPNECR
jgi:hypothetical protein